MRTKWQSGNRKKCGSLKGNRFFGDDEADLAGKPAGPKPQTLLCSLPYFYIDSNQRLLPFLLYVKGEKLLGQIRLAGAKKI